MEITDAEPVEWPLLDELRKVLVSRHSGTESYQHGYTRCEAHSDHSAQEIELPLHHRPEDVGGVGPEELARQASVTSPFMPAALAARIESDWNSVAPGIQRIEAESGDNPDVGAALARQYKKLGKTDDAVRVLKRYVKVSPDYWAFQMLADIQLAAGDENAWLQTLEQALQLPDYGLNHAQINGNIADHLMSQEQYERAEPYARASADSGAEWALRIAADCFAGLGKWDEAEEMIRDAAIRYSEVEVWYMWCVETGHGHLAEVSRIMARAAAIGANPKAVACYLLGQGETGAAITELRHSTRQPLPGWDNMMIALWCKQNNDQKGCDDMLGRLAGHVSEDQDDWRRGLLKLAALFQECRSGGTAKKLDLDKVEQCIASSSKADLPSVFYFTGKFLELRGQEADAQRYYGRCMATNDKGMLDRMLSAMELRKRSIDPMAVRFSRPTAAPSVKGA